MKGKHRIIVQNNRLHYEFEIKRSITIIQGDSATGKTTLINMVRQHANLGAASGIDLSCDVPCRVLEGTEWKLLLEHTSGSILFIDEENTFVRTEDFAAAARDSGNYFVLITRENLYALPYSVEEIYGLKSSGRYQNTKQIYQQTYRIYSDQMNLPVHPEKLITEDSNAGYEFFDAVGREAGISCLSAAGKSNLYKMLRKQKNEKICVIADGAAIGPEMNRLYELSLQNPNIVLYFPESFEWIILRSGLIDGKELQKILSEPENHIESREFFSWEQYFVRLLIDYTADGHLRYSKKKLNEVYLHEKNRKAILSVMRGIIFEPEDTSYASGFSLGSVGLYSNDDG